MTVLPIAAPPINGLLKWAYTLSVSSYYPETLPWFRTNFAQVYCNQDFLDRQTEFVFDFFRGFQPEYTSNPFVQAWVVASKPQPFDPDHISENLKECIDEGYYPVLFVDEQEISDRAAYHKWSQPHRILLYGYDTEKTVFYTSGLGANLIYGTHQVPFSELESAYRAIRLQIASCQVPEQDSYLLRFNFGFRYEFDIAAVAIQLEEYLNGSVTEFRIDRNLEQYAFGSKTYECLRQYYDALANGESLVKRHDIRHLHILWEHKRLLWERVKYMNDAGWSINSTTIASLQELSRRCLSLKTLLIKHGLRPIPKVFEMIHHELSEIETLEIIAIHKLLNEIGRASS